MARAAAVVLGAHLGFLLGAPKSLKPVLHAVVLESQQSRYGNQGLCLMLRPGIGIKKMEQ